MSSTDKIKNPVQQLPSPALKVFNYFLYPLAVVGQIVLIVSKFSEGITTSGDFNLPNWVSVLCGILTICVMTYPMLLAKAELGSRSKNEEI